MDDNKIIALYWQRNESAIDESNKKYGNYCRTIAYNILNSHEETEECINDTWHNAWRAIPPEKPKKLQYFFGRIARNLALDRYGYNKAQKRNADVQFAIDEFWECIPNGDAPIEDTYLLKELLDSFLESLDSRSRIIFLRRYWYACSVQEIAKSMDLTEGHISTILHRTRSKLKAYLKQEGVSL